MNTSSADVDPLKQRPDFAEERRARIAELVRTQGSVRIADLVGPLGVSEPTLRKDLTFLENQRLLKRTHGGAIAVEASPETDMSTRHTINVEAKNRIADYCAEMVSHASSVFIDSGTTALKITERMDNMDVNVVTNSVPAAQVLADKPRVRHTLLGGQFRPLGDCMTGPIAIENLARFTVDITFLGIVGASEDGLTVLDVAEGDVKRAAVERARRVVLPLDTSKVGKIGFCHLLDWDRIDDLVTEAHNPDLAKWCESAGVRLHVAD